MQQIAFDFISDDYNLDEFIVSESNKLAYDAIDSWPHETWGVNPYPKALIMRGPESSGKTYLARKWARNSGALFIQQMHELTPSILDYYHAFIIDNYNESWAEHKLLHYFNYINENGKYLLITTRKIPHIQLADLRSRINSVNKLEISLPDDELIKMFIFKLFSNYSVNVGPEIISYLIRILPREISSITEAVKLINAYAIEHKHKITIPLIKQVLGK